MYFGYNDSLKLSVIGLRSELTFMYTNYLFMIDEVELWKIY